jgi:hypothetical protein
VRNPCYCHCGCCRRAAGATAVAWGTLARRAFRITHGVLQEFGSSAPVSRGRCGVCGSALTYRHDARPAEIDVTLASLDQPAACAPRMHVWVSEKLPWVLIADGLPQFAKDARLPG